MANGHKTGGRKRGTPNKATQEKRALIDNAAKDGVTPLQHMLRIMRNESEAAARRDDMAKAAAPFIHPRLAAIEHKGEDGTPLQIMRIERVIVDPKSADGETP